MNGEGSRDRLWVFGVNFGLSVCVEISAVMVTVGEMPLQAAELVSWSVGV
jgi:hypothetical protein